MERLSALDAEFIYLETDAVHLHVGACAVFEGPAPSFQEFTTMTASKMPRVPRFRHVIREVPYGLGRPVWVDDPDFALGHHLHHAALPAPGDERQLQRFTSLLMAQRLDRARPLWESWMIEGLDGDRWAVVTKAHHAMVDGVAAVEMMNVLLDLEPTAPLAEPEPWEPESEPSDVQLVVDAVGGFAGQVANAVGAVAALLARPQRLVENLGRDRDGLVATGRGFQGGGGGRGVLADRVGPHRHWDWADLDLNEVKEVKGALGGTVNDVVLAVIAAGFRTLLEARDEPVEGLTLRTLVPVSVRGDDEHDQANNKVSGLFAELPVGIDNPVGRLEFVSRQMGELKRSGAADLGQAATSFSDLLFPGILAAASRTTMRFAERRPRLPVDTVTTNVPGPQIPLYALGRKLLGYYPYVPVMHGVPITIAILSYNNRIAFGVTGDHDAAPDIGVLVNGIDVGLAELLKASADAPV